MKNAQHNKKGIPMITDSIFREYDIRGVIGRDINANGFSLLGSAFATYVEHQAETCKIVVGYDGRLTSQELVSALIQGLTHSGAEVINIGCGPTPMLYFASYHLGATAAMMVTGSHNPPEYNGLKMVVGNKALMAEEVKIIGEMAQDHDFRTETGAHQEDLDLAHTYADTLLKDFKTYYPPTFQRIAWDAGNGATGRLIEELVKRLPGEHILLNTEIDGRFPNHHPDPTIEKNMRQLQDVVRANQCDYGIGFDGDGDRLGIVDDLGRMLCADQIMMLFAQEILEQHPGATIIGDVKTSNHFFEKVTALGGIPLMWWTGHSHIKKKMREVKSPLAGEMSGHIFFADSYFGFDDGLYAALRFIGIMAQRCERLST